MWTLEEIGAPYEVTIVSREDRGSEEHRERHPLGRVPVVELDNGRTLFESAAICLHLADLHLEAGLILPVGTYQRGLTYQWSLFAMTEVEKRVFSWLFAKRAKARTRANTPRALCRSATRCAMQSATSHGSRARCPPSPTFFAPA
jgi:glutathione S-transferase